MINLCVIIFLLNSAPLQSCCVIASGKRNLRRTLGPSAFSLWRSKDASNVIIRERNTITSSNSIGRTVVTHLPWGNFITLYICILLSVSLNNFAGVSVSWWWKKRYRGAKELKDSSGTYGAQRCGSETDSDRRGSPPHNGPLDNQKIEDAVAEYNSRMIHFFGEIQSETTENIDIKILSGPC